MAFKKMKLLAVVLLSSCLRTEAQEVVVFTKGLVAAQSHQYGRQAIVSDHFAYQLNRDTLARPVKDSTLATGEDKKVYWLEVEADTSGTFRGRGLANGYVYLTYHSTKEQNALMNISGNAMFYFNGVPHA